MKNLFKAFVLMAVVPFLMESCSKSNAQPNTPVNSSNGVQADLSGNWQISSFAQRTEDKTHMFDGYVFTFDKSGAMTATVNNSSTSGIWAFATAPVGYYGSQPSKSSFTINIGSATPLINLTKTWNVDSVHTNTTTLALLSPEVAEGMHLTFSKQ